LQVFGLDAGFLAQFADRRAVNVLARINPAERA